MFDNPTTQYGSIAKSSLFVDTKMFWMICEIMLPSPKILAGKRGGQPNSIYIILIWYDMAVNQSIDFSYETIITEIPFIKNIFGSLY